MAHTFEDLVTLERAAEAAHDRLLADATDPDAARQAWVKAAAEFQAAVTEYAETDERSRYEIEMAVKKAVRHPKQDDA
ncbi:hypothetical protein [Streptomyces sp. CPS1]